MCDLSQPSIHFTLLTSHPSLNPFYQIFYQKAICLPDAQTMTPVSLTHCTIPFSLYEMYFDVFISDHGVPLEQLQSSPPFKASIICLYTAHINELHSTVASLCARNGKCRQESNKAWLSTWRCLLLWLQLDSQAPVSMLMGENEQGSGSSKSLWHKGMKVKRF